MKQFKSAPGILTNSQRDEVNFYDCSTAAIELLTEECRKFKITPAFGSVFTVSDEPTISFPGAHAVTVTHGMETLCLTWNGDTFKDRMIDQIGEVEEGMISMNFSGHAVSMTATAAQELFETEQTLSIAEKCQGITLRGATCRKKTLKSYQASGGDIAWKPLCWCHKQQILM